MSWLNGGMLIGAAYILAQELIRPMAIAHVGVERDCGSTPCWRAELVLTVQLGFLPLSVLTPLYVHKWSVNDWCDAWGQRALNALEQGAVSIFALFMLLDFYYHCLLPPLSVLPVLRPVMVVHHCVCLLGHLYATLICPRASVPYYLSAICCLEVGSGFANIFFLRDKDAMSWWAYMLGMTVSNLGASAYTLGWNARARAAGAHSLMRWPAVLITAALIYLRQVELRKYL